MSINGGYNHSAKVGAYGFGLTIKGFHLTIGGSWRIYSRARRESGYMERKIFLFNSNWIPNSYNKVI
ncbi:hypothetical protein IX307_000853 [Bacteroides pyogenes]|nr:hypothetical protein [Bacteroides pyogenes]MBR8786544.1 hypothetical protein [Bacteroides pyogenes]MBR8792027.1 hypothetical protein [Bacteroides pyogenes]